MEKGESGFKAIVVGSSISILGTLLIVTIAVLAAGHKAFDITMHGANHQEVFVAVTALASSTVFLLPLIALGLTITSLASFISTRFFDEQQTRNSIVVGVTFMLSLVIVATLAPVSFPIWAWFAFILLPMPAAVGGSLASKAGVKHQAEPVVFRNVEDATKQRTVQHIERDREFVEQYALLAAQRKQELVMGRKSLLDERREQERAKAQATARMRAIARAAFMSHPAATDIDFERCWPEIRDDLLRHHTLQILTDAPGQIDEMTPEIQRASAQSMLRIAGSSSNSRTINLLVGGTTDGDVGSSQRTAQQVSLALVNACREGNTVRLKALVEAGAEVNVTNHEGWTPLMIAALKGHLEIARILVAKGAALEAANGSGWTALRFACSVSDLDIIKLLIENGADVDSLDDKGWSILMQAADEGNAASIKILLENGVNKEIRNLAHESALSIALRRGHADIVQLLKKSAPPTKRHAIN